MSMKPEKYIGHEAFRVVESKLYPAQAGTRLACWLLHRDGTEVFFIHGTIRPPKIGDQIVDIIAGEVFGEACHRCVCRHSEGTIANNGDYVPHSSTTSRTFKENPWGKLCVCCRKDVVSQAYARFLSECRRLDVRPEDFGCWGPKE